MSPGATKKRRQQVQGGSAGIDPPHNGGGRAAGMTIIEALRLAEAYLRKHGVESPRLSAEHLLAKACSCERIDLYMRFDMHAGENVLAAYRADLRKRAEHYPLQYLLGEVGFYSLRFAVREGVFIPRPETELLVEWIEEILEGRKEIRFLEFGVGTGVISGALTARHPHWSGTAFDVSPVAACLARENFESLGVAGRMSVFVSDGFGALGAGSGFDMLVANPPYIPSGEIVELQREVSAFEDRSAINGGGRGTRFYPVLARTGRTVLRPGGLLALEIGDGQAAEVERVLGSSGYKRITMRRDYNGFERMVTAFVP